MISQRARPAIVAASALAAAIAVLLGAVAPAAAIPPGGASPDTPGTASVVWPTVLAPGETIFFEVTGYPAGETLNVKIDDGLGYSDTDEAGSGVVHLQAIRSDGTVSGSLVLPDDIAEGEHWLRFLASEPILDDVGEQIGVNGYTRRGGADFTVVSAEAAQQARDAGTAGPTSGEQAWASLEADDAEPPAAAPGEEITAPGPAEPEGADEGPGAGDDDGATDGVVRASLLVAALVGAAVLLVALIAVRASRRRRDASGG